MIAALEAEGLPVYAPRAGRFLEVNEAMDVLGIMLAIFGRPRIEGMGHDLYDFEDYLTRLNARASLLQQGDPLLKLTRILRSASSSAKARHNWLMAAFAMLYALAPRSARSP